VGYSLSPCRAGNIRKALRLQRFNWQRAVTRRFANEDHVFRFALERREALNSIVADLLIPID
jgi:hypothetical protein